jgi:hypothetical protein
MKKGVKGRRQRFERIKFKNAQDYQKQKESFYPKMK